MAEVNFFVLDFLTEGFDLLLISFLLHLELLFLLFEEVVHYLQGCDRFGVEVLVIVDLLVEFVN